MGIAFTLNRFGNLAGAFGDHELGREWLEEALALRRELGDRERCRDDARQPRLLAARGGELDRGRSLVGEALALFEETDDPPGQMGMRLNPGTWRPTAASPNALQSCSRLLGRWPNPSACFDARAGRRSRRPSWRSPPATPRARPGCWTRRSGTCARSATGGASPAA